MGVQASGATLEIQLVADVARLKSDMAQMQSVVAQATGNVSGSFNRMASGTGAAATAMAASAQKSAREAMGLGSAYASATGHIAVNTVAMRESIVLMREFARGNYSRMAGSFTILAQSLATSGMGVRGLAMMLLQLTGVLKVTQNAELAEAAAQKAGIAAAIQSRAERAASAVVARQAQVAIAQATLKAAEGANAQKAAQKDLEKALRSVEVATGKAAIAQEALTAAELEAAQAGKAAKAAAVTSLGGTGVALAVLAPVAALAAGNMIELREQFKQTGELTKFRDNLGLTHDEMLRLSDGVKTLHGSIKDLTDVVPTYGDIIHGFFDTVAQSADIGLWGKTKSAAKTAFDYIVEYAKMGGDGITAALVGTYNAVKLIWGNFPAAFSDLFVSAVNAAIEALNSLVKHGTDLLNGFIDSANKIPGIDIGHVTAPQIGLLDNPNAGAAAKAISGLGQAYADAYHQAQKEDQAFTDALHRNIAKRVEDRLRDEAAAIKAARAPKHKKQGDHGLAEALAELNAEIKGQLALADAYLVSDAAAIKATALQKAEEDAIRHKSQTGVFYELELAKAVATGAAEAAKKVAALRDENDARHAVNDNVASGLLSYRKMNDALKDQEALQPLLVLQSLATGRAYAELTRVIDAYREALKRSHAEEDRSKAVEELGKRNEAHQQTIALLNREAGLTGIEKDRRDEILKLLQDELQLRAEFPGLTEAEIRATIAQTAAEDNLRRHLDRVEAGMEAVKQTGQQIVDDVFNVDNWTDPFKALLSILKEVEQEFVTLAFANPLKNALYGQNNPTLGSVGGIGGFFSALFGGGGGSVLNLGSAVPSFSSAMASAAIPTVDIGAFPGLAGGGWRPIGGIGGTDQNLLSLNGQGIARVSSDEHLAVIPRGFGQANDNGGNHSHYHITVAGTGDRLKDRQTGMQYAAGMDAQQARRRRKGML